MRIRVKPVVAGVCVGAALAAGAVVAIDNGSQPAEAQSSSSVQAQLNELEQQQQIIQRQNIRAIKQVNTYSQYMKYLLDAGEIVGVNSNAPNQARGVGGGWTAGQLSQAVQANWPYWVEIWYDGTTTFWQSRGATNVVRNGPGDYTVTWGQNIQNCAQTVAITNYGTNNPSNKYGKVDAYYGGSNTTTNYKSWNSNPSAADSSAADYPISAHLVCSPATGTNQN